MNSLRLVAGLLVLTIFAAGCGSGSAETGEKTDGNGKSEFAGEELAVYAAAHLTETFSEMEKVFEKKTGADVTINFAGTQTLRTQIEQGAPADVFASANLGHMKAVKKEGFVEQYKTFGYNTLTVIIPKSNPAGLKDFKDLGKKDYKLVIGVDNVPIGIYTRQVLDHAAKKYGSDFKKNIMDNVVSFGPNVKKVAGKVALGAADAGFIYVSGLTPSVEKKVKTIQIPNDLNVTATDTIAVVKTGDHPELAKKWIAFVMSEEGQQILADHHLIPLDEKKK
ncbi:MAG TPA: molybdate ABC transporter substrate-binding protein [Bacillales bacterium]|nr:molybdate ABC transporter substrate-binding protein [Bacillales bacterium]